jgi:RimJ/RimL family protein N-acetyltransferase
VSSTVSIRHASPADLDFLVELVNHEEVDPFVGLRRARDRATILAQIERTQAEPDAFGRLIIEADGKRAGLLGYSCVNPIHRIAEIEALAVHPDFRDRGIAGEAVRLLQRLLIFELGYHRLELECYSFNERAIRHAERAGFTREGVKRKAYWRHGEWVDGVLFGLVADDLDG